MFKWIKKLIRKVEDISVSGGMTETELPSSADEKVEVKYLESMNIVNEQTLKKIEDAIVERKLFLNPRINVSKLAQHVGSNRTYTSRAICSKYGTFRNYITKVRVDNLISYIYDNDTPYHIIEDGEELAYGSGFINRRAMDRALIKSVGKSYAEIRDDILMNREN